MSGHDVSFQGSVMMRRSHYVGATNLALCWRCTYRSFGERAVSPRCVPEAARPGGLVVFRGWGEHGEGGRRACQHPEFQ
jgi:hypothetical protein